MHQVETIFQDTKSISDDPSKKKFKHNGKPPSDGVRHVKRNLSTGVSMQIHQVSLRQARRQDKRHSRLSLADLPKAGEKDEEDRIHSWQRPTIGSSLSRIFIVFTASTVTTTMWTTSRHADLPLIWLLLSSFLFCGLYLYSVRRTEISIQIKYNYILVNLCNGSRSSNSITSNPLMFAELEQILYYIKLERQLDKTSDAPGACTAFKELHSGSS